MLIATARDLKLVLDLTLCPAERLGNLSKCMGVTGRGQTQLDDSPRPSNHLVHA